MTAFTACLHSGLCAAPDSGHASGGCLTDSVDLNVSVTRLCNMSKRIVSPCAHNLFSFPDASSLPPYMATVAGLLHWHSLSLSPSLFSPLPAAVVQHRPALTKPRDYLSAYMSTPAALSYVVRIPFPTSARPRLRGDGTYRVGEAANPGPPSEGEVPPTRLAGAGCEPTMVEDGV